MEVIRKCKKDVKKFQVGDQIVLGRYTATAVAQDESGTTFCFDQVYGEAPMKGPFDWKKTGTLYKSKIMDSVRDMLVPFVMGAGEDLLSTFRSPTAEEVAPKTNLRAVDSTVIPNANKRWEAMKSGYRIALDVNGKPRNYWTESTVNPNSQICKNEGSHVYVTASGFLGGIDPDQSSYIYWRPVFKLK